MKVQENRLRFRPDELNINRHFSLGMKPLEFSRQECHKVREVNNQSAREAKGGVWQAKILLGNVRLLKPILAATAWRLTENSR